MLPEQHGFFELCIVRSKLMLGYKSTVEQQFDGIVQCCPADPVLMIFHPDVQRFNIEMPFRCKDFLQDCVPLRSFPVCVFFQVLGKNFPYILSIVLEAFFYHTVKICIKVAKYIYLELI